VSTPSEDAGNLYSAISDISKVASLLPPSNKKDFEIPVSLTEERFETQFEALLLLESGDDYEDHSVKSQTEIMWCT